MYFPLRHVKTFEEYNVAGEILQYQERMPCRWHSILYQAAQEKLAIRYNVETMWAEDGIVIWLPNQSHDDFLPASIDPDEIDANLHGPSSRLKPQL